MNMSLPLIQDRPTCQQVRAAGRAKRLCLFGAAPDTGNLGVSALGASVLRAVADRDPFAVVTVFDHGRGVRYDHVSADRRRFDYRRCGAVHTRRFWRPECLWEIRASAWLPMVRNAAAETIRRADVVLDVSGGDSFSDLYGRRRFRAVTLPKQIAIEQGRPLILLPQTYGPFRSDGARRLAARIVRRATMAWARDRASFGVLRDLLGDAFHPDRHRCGVDIAFALPAQAPADEASSGLGAAARWLDEPRGRPIVGVNVSGLLYNDSGAAARYGLRADYRQVVHRLLRRLVSETDARIMIVPHVRPTGARGECDLRAGRAAVASLDGAGSERIALIDGIDEPSGAKWLIGHCDWFCGTRLHATIAAMSSGVPAAAIAYSDKAAGVFETCGLHEHVADPRRQSSDDVVDRLWRSWSGRDSARAALAAHRAEIVRAATAPFDQVLGAMPRTPGHVEVRAERRAA
ncbi:MAG: polysaccharide pyruvyl transferase family protein [Planctomycetota bacterium]|jgi:polysaccharide pyruvyl transferase WcaK-like protein